MAQLLANFATDQSIVMREVNNVILIDLDDTIYHSMREWIARYNKKYGKNQNIEHVNNYEIHKCAGFNTSIYEILNDNDLYTVLEPMQEALNCVYELSKEFICIFCSHAVNGKAAEQKFIQIVENIKLHDAHKFKFINDHIHFGKHKTLINCYAIIDDNPVNALGNKAAFNSLALGIEFPWNTKFRDKYDLLAASYQKPDEAWKQITKFLLEAKAAGTRYNKNKAPWSLLPRLTLQHGYEKCIASHSIFEKSFNYEELLGRAIFYANSWFSSNNKLYAYECFVSAMVLSGFIRTIDNPSLQLPINSGIVNTALLYEAGLASTTDIMKFGCSKYAARNWEKGLYVEQTWECLKRHYDKVLIGEKLDSESNLPHEWHAGWNAMALVEMLLRGERNDKYKKFVKRYNWKH